MMSDPSAVGAVGPAEAWEILKTDPSAVLVDVRTAAEWQTIGVPVLDDLGKTPVFVPWQQVPGGPPNPDFVAELQHNGVAADATVLFLCRSGVRSLAAAQLMSAHGFTRTINVEEGFEGFPDATGRRGTVNGWQAAGLPWR